MVCSVGCLYGWQVDPMIDTILRTDEVLQDLTELTANLATVKGDDVAMLDNLILERRVLCSMSALGALC